MSNFIKKRFCVRGHDTDIVGRDKWRSCKVCAPLRKKTDHFVSYRKEYYAKNRERIIARQREYFNINREDIKRKQRQARIDNKEEYRKKYQETLLWVQAIKLTRGCADCGYRKYPEALDFDHLPGTKKNFEICKFGRQAKRNVEKEIDKCEVVCANCHRHRTKTRREQVRITGGPIGHS